jgi:hypothetical protein
MTPLEQAYEQKCAECDVLHKRVAGLESQVLNQAAIITGKHQYVGQDFKFRIERLQEQLSAAEKERDHWKANHANRVAAAKVLIDRTDLPFERVKAYEKYVEMQDRLAGVEKERDELRQRVAVLESDHDRCTTAIINAALRERDYLEKIDAAMKLGAENAERNGA